LKVVGSLLVVRPHSKDFDCLFLVEDLIDEAMLDVDAAGIGSCQIADKLLVGRRILVRIVGHYGEKPFSLPTKSARG
jgi:hypothetical protein